MKHFVLPEGVSRAVSEGAHVVRAYREHLGYSVEALAVACGLTAEEIERIEAGYRYEKGYRERIAKALGLPADAFEDAADIEDAA